MLFRSYLSDSLFERVYVKKVLFLYDTCAKVLYRIDQKLDGELLYLRESKILTVVLFSLPTVKNETCEAPQPTPQICDCQGLYTTKKIGGRRHRMNHHFFFFKS